MQRAVSMALDQNPHNIAGYVLGEHGESQFAAWSTITVQGEPITEIAKDQHLELAELDKAARGGGWLVFNGKNTLATPLQPAQLNSFKPFSLTQNLLARPLFI